MVHTFCVLRNLCLSQSHRDFLSAVFYRVLEVTFRSVIHLEFVCMSVWCKTWIEVLFGHMVI